MSTFGVRDQKPDSSSPNVLCVPLSCEDVFADYVYQSGNNTAVRIMQKVQQGSVGNKEQGEKEIQRKSIGKTEQELNEAPEKPLPFGVRSTFPRLIHPIGIKRVTVTIDDQNGSQGEGLDSGASSNCTYTYQDEHSAPFSWRTRSTQDLSMEPEEDVNNDNLETLAASPSKILNNRGINLARYSRGNPSFAKPVQIPTVPKCIPVKSAMDNANRNSCVVSNVRPEQINNFVYQSPEQKLVMDFGEINLNEDGTAPTNVPPPSPPVVADCSRTSSPDSTRSSRSILTKMRRTFSSARARRKSSELSSATDASSLASLESNGEYYYAKRLSLQQHQPARPSSALSNTNSLRMVRKPTVAPPPPPPSKTSTLPKMLDSKPPKPPTRTTPVKRQQSERKDQMAAIGDGKSNVEHVTGDEKKEEPKETNEELLGEFKIDLTTTSSQDLPKTGFDFLDNW